MPLNIVQRIIYPQRLQDMVKQLEAEGDLNYEALNTPFKFSSYIGLTAFSITVVCLIATDKTQYIALGALCVAAAVLYITNNTVQTHLIPTFYSPVPAKITQLERINPFTLQPSGSNGWKMSFVFSTESGQEIESTPGTIPKRFFDSAPELEQYIKIFYDRENPEKNCVFLPVTATKYVLRKSNLIS